MKIENQQVDLYGGLKMANIFTSIFGKTNKVSTTPKTVDPDTKDGDFYSPTAFSMNRTNISERHTPIWSKPII